MENIKKIEELKIIAHMPSLYLRKLKAKNGQKILGYFCINTPEEMILASGFLPVRILRTQERIALAGKHLQTYCCSLVQSSLECALRGDFDYLEGTVFPHTCDSIQRLSDIWAENVGLPFHWDLILPVKLHTESARDYLLSELRRFLRGLEDFSGRKIPDNALRKAIALTNANRSLLRRLYELRTAHPEKLSPKEFFALAQTAGFMPKEEHNGILQQFLRDVETRKPASRKRVPLFLVGSIGDPLSFSDLWESCGASIVGDDFCTGWRSVSEDVAEGGNPLEALADRLISRTPCPCKYNPEFDRGEELARRVSLTRARGVLFVLQKFCDPHAFDYPYLREKLEERGIPTLLLEIEPASIPREGLATRIQAFVETLGGSDDR
jgi:benzoyl-CoA reductase subunit C